MDKAVLWDVRFVLCTQRIVNVQISSVTSHNETKNISWL